MTFRVGNPLRIRRAPADAVVVVGLVVAAVLGGALATVMDFTLAFRMILLLAAAIAAFLSPAAFLFLVCATGNNGFGLVDLTEETGSGPLAMDLVMVVLVGAVALRCAVNGELGSMRTRLRDPRSRFLLGMLALVAVWCVVTVVKFEQEPILTLKAARATLYYAFGLWGLFATLDDRERDRCLRALALGGLFLSVIVVLGFFLDLDLYLPGIPRVSEYAGSSEVHFRTVPLGHEFLYLGFFVFAFCERILSKWFRTIGLLATSLGIIVVAFRAFWIGIALALLLLQVETVARRRKQRRMFATIMAVLVLAIGILSFTGGADIVMGRFASIRTEIGEGTGSVGIRMAQVDALAPFLMRNPLTGIGFLHAEGPLGYELTPLKSLLIHRFGTTDVGWMDVLIRFGALGGIAWVGLFVMLYRSLTRSALRADGSVAVVEQAMILTGLFALPGAALFSVPNGILTLVLPCGILIASEAGGPRGKGR